MAENKLPGFGLPRNYGLDTNYNANFPNALDYDGLGWLSQGTMMRERRMMAFMGQITDKPDWQTKIYDDAIVAKWRAEAKAQPNVEKGDVFMSGAMFDYCIAELKDKAAASKETGYVKTLDAELTVTKSDTAVSDDLAAELRKFVATLEDVPDHEKDWHPGSDNKVLDLLHPSLFPVVYGLTRALRTGKVPLKNCAEYTGKGDIAGKERKSKKQEQEMISWASPPEDDEFMDEYQWLPSDIVFADSGAKITSYINNLHPDKHPELYGVFEKFVDAAVPLWEECLSSFKDARRFKLEGTDDENDYYIPEGLKYAIPRSSGNGTHGDGEGSDPDSDGEVHSDEEEEWRWSEEYADWRNEHRILKWPEPEAYVPVAERTVKTKAKPARVNLRSQEKYPEGLQIIFKLANIHLTPDGEVTVEGGVDAETGEKREGAAESDDAEDGNNTAKYYGGSWHVEGTLAERICATALYYYDEENITPSSLSFRTSVDHEELIMLPAQSAFNSLEAYFGIENEKAAVIELGSVLTRPGRLLAFPNVLQHRVGSFKLRDQTQPGHRKILAMFLVDPNRRILSSAHVPPQRKDWWAEQVYEDSASGSISAKNNLMSKLPNELFNHTMEMVEGFPISWDEAVAIRADLMAKRGLQAEEQNNEIYGATFSFCEH
ncbi:hypothetical protein F503_01586 [Ophiostoma piceae UAMH 11346]|uniref:Duf1665 domain containing protein n=1 Tax=Ophiostoma piceae (strain UAMH 11346) TaxID=1262450 RepID=S3CQD8_OPHP1|nr:hypothetical protein F503_01586 [Ophiostoma piceae UAMH 11346]